MPHSPLATLALLTVLTGGPFASAQTYTPTLPTEATIMTQHAKGPFDVKMAPQEQDTGEGSTLGRLSLDKVFHGDLEATGKGQMLTASTETPGSAVYVAVERVTGALHGKTGSFALVHRGIMRGDERTLTVDIVPDSGSGALKGITGRLTIEILEGKHLYDLAYSLPGH